MNLYLYKGKRHSNYSESYMRALGMDDDTIQSVLAQRDYEQTAAQLERRRAAYAAESDPLFIEAKYDECAEKLQAWRDKVQEIKARYPLPAA